LLVEDAPSLQRVYSSYLKDEPVDILLADTVRDAMQGIAHRRFDAVLLDLQLPDGNGMEVLKALRARGDDVAVVVMTANGSVQTAVEAMRAGANDFIVKPFDGTRLRKTLHGVLEARRLNAVGRNGRITEIGSHTDHFEGFIGSSAEMRAIYATIENAAPSKASVFITGESGTGKEVCAQAIHARSKRSNKPFVAINCAAIPRDLLESEIFGHVRGAFTGAHADKPGAAQQADGGTLFLDELAEMDMEMQSKLLRFIQTGTVQRVGGTRSEQVDVRFIAATNRDPRTAVAAGRLREDLYYRLHVVPIDLPPLRKRGNDLLLIARKLLVGFASEEGKRFTGFDPEVERLFLSYDWPGNVRELQNIVRRIVVLHDGERVSAGMLPPPLSGAASAKALRKDPAHTEHFIPDIVPQVVLDSAPGLPKDHPDREELEDILKALVAKAPKAAEGEDVEFGADAFTLIPPGEMPTELPPPPPSVRETLKRDEQTGSTRPDALDIKPLAQIEREAIEQALAATGGNVPRAAALLEVNPSTIYRKLKAWKDEEH